MTETWYSRTVFFVGDGERSLEFYTDKLGFSLDWNYEYEGRPHVFQVSLNGLELILNQVEEPTRGREGSGRVFVGLEDDQVEGFWQHIESHGIKTTVQLWGEPTVVVRDPDGNEIFFWLSDSEKERLRREME